METATKSSGEHLTPNQLRADLRLNVEDFFLAAHDFHDALPTARRFESGPLVFAPPSKEQRRCVASFARRNAELRREEAVRNRHELVSLAQLSGRYCLSLNHIIELEWSGDLPAPVLLHGRAYFRCEDLPAWEQRWVVAPASVRRRPEPESHPRRTNSSVVLRPR